MSYSSFLDSLIGPINLFINSIKDVAAVLINNYIFITILGIVVFCSLVIWLFDLVLDYFYKKRSDLDNYIERKQSYSLNQDISMDYYFHNYYKIFGFKLNKYRMQQLVKYSHFTIYRSDEQNYAYRRLILNKEVDSHYLTNNNDLEFNISSKRYDLFTDMSYNYKLKKRDKVLRNKVYDIELNESAGNIVSDNRKQAHKKNAERLNSSGTILPKWFNKDIKKIKPSESEKEEMENIINNF